MSKREFKALNPDNIRTADLRSGRSRNNSAASIEEQVSSPAKTDDSSGSDDTVINKTGQREENGSSPSSDNSIKIKTYSKIVRIRKPYPHIPLLAH